MPGKMYTNKRPYEAGESYKNKLAKMKANKKVKPIGSRVQSPDQQYATGMMGKQPIAVFPRLKGQR